MNPRTLGPRIQGEVGRILPPCGGDAAHLDRRAALKLAAGLGLGVALRSIDVLAAEDDKSVRPRKGRTSGQDLESHQYSRALYDVQVSLRARQKGQR